MPQKILCNRRLPYKMKLPYKMRLQNKIGLHHRMKLPQKVRLLNKKMLRQKTRVPHKNRLHYKVSLFHKMRLAHNTLKQFVFCPRKLRNQKDLNYPPAESYCINSMSGLQKHFGLAESFRGFIVSFRILVGYQIFRD